MSDGKLFVGGVHVRIVPPAEALRPFVTAYYTLEIESDVPVIDYLIPEWTNLRLIHRGSFNVGSGPFDCKPLSGPVATGPTTKPIYISATSTAAFGIGVLPTGWARFGWPNARQFADRYPPLETLIGPTAHDLMRDISLESSFEAQCAIADSYFLALLADKRESADSQAVASLQHMLNGLDVTSVEQLADQMGLSQTRLARLCVRYFGFPPKLLLRRQRFLRMLAILNFQPYETWRDFLDPHYVDQSHFIRDFKYFLTMSPRAYLALPRPIQQPAIRQRAEVIGTPVQGLHQMKDDGDLGRSDREP